MNFFQIQVIQCKVLTHLLTSRQQLPTSQYQSSCACFLDLLLDIMSQCQTLSRTCHGFHTKIYLKKKTVNHHQCEMQRKPVHCMLPFVQYSRMWDYISQGGATKRKGMSGVQAKCGEYKRVENAYNGYRITQHCKGPNQLCRIT